MFLGTPGYFSDTPPACLSAADSVLSASCPDERVMILPEGRGGTMRLYLLKNLFVSFLQTILLVFLAVSAEAAELKWYKGNTHTHTINSDGDSTPEKVVSWYREHGYNFVALTDHNFLTEVSGLNAIFGATDRFLVIAGEEVTNQLGEKPLHVNGLNVRRVVSPAAGNSVSEMLTADIAGIREAGGVPHINHPNFRWAVSAEDLDATRDYKLFEIYNGHPLTHNHGGGGTPSPEEIWDILLSGGKRIYGIATDDAHHFQGEFQPSRSNPGRGWVVVRAAELTAEAILSALENGNFYASTGVVLSAVTATSNQVSVTIQPEASFRYTTYFIADNGRVVGQSPDLESAYRFSGGEKYVRARIVDSGGKTAWTQPVFVEF
jgi:hypothetical protein